MKKKLRKETMDILKEGLSDLTDIMWDAARSEIEDHLSIRLFSYGTLDVHESQTGDDWGQAELSEIVTEFMRWEDHVLDDIKRYGTGEEQQYLRGDMARIVRTARVFTQQTKRLVEFSNKIRDTYKKANP